MYYTAGSDDFRAYVWKIPDESALLESRKVVEYSDWIKNRRPGELGAWIRLTTLVLNAHSFRAGYSATALGPRYVPQEISIPLARLTGNSLLFRNDSTSSCEVSYRARLDRQHGTLPSALSLYPHRRNRALHPPAQPYRGLALHRAIAADAHDGQSRILRQPELTGDLPESHGNGRRPKYGRRR